MKHLNRLLLIAIVLLLFSQPGFAFVNALTHSPVLITASTTKHPIITPFAAMTVKDFLALTPKKYRELTGKRMSLSQKISLKIAQYKVKKLIKQNKQVNLNTLTRDIDTTDVNIGGLVLGLLLGPIGVLIAYLIDDRNVIKWAWIGSIPWFIIAILVLVV